MDLDTFDPATAAPADLRQAQQVLADLKFYGDTVDDDFGGESRRALAGYRAACTGDVVDVLLSQVGAQEAADHNNDGPTVDLYLDSCGLRGSRLPWCAAFQTWGIHRWAEHTANPPKFKLPTTAGAFAFETIAESIPGAQIFHPGQDQFTLKRGDILIYKFSHIGMLVEVGPDGVLHVVEGNTNSDGSRDGYEVIVHPRYLSAVKFVVRLPW